MISCRRNWPEHDLTLHLVSGNLTSAEIVHLFRNLDAGCATRWLSYFDPTVEMSQIDIASVPELKRVIAEKRRELFGDRPKPYAIVCGSEESEQYFVRFWWKYFAGPNAQAENLRCFRNLDAAYDWLELPEAGRAAVARAIEDWEIRAADDLAQPAAAREAPKL